MTEACVASEVLDAVIVDTVVEIVVEVEEEEEEEAVIGEVSDIVRHGFCDSHQGRSRTWRSSSPARLNVPPLKLVEHRDSMTKDSSSHH